MEFSTFVLFFILFVIVGANLVAIYWFGQMLIPLVSGGGPYVPSPWERVKLMIELARITPEDRVIDLGSGDGRIVIAAAEAGAKNAKGYEIHYGLIRRARRLAKQKGVQERTEMICQSFWNADVSQASVLFLYQIPYAMGKIGEKLKKELPMGARIVSSGFTLPNWEPVEVRDRVYLYIKS